MNRNMLIVAAIAIVIGWTSGILTYLRTENMAMPADIAAKGLDTIRRDTVLFYGIFLPMVVGVISWFVYKGMYAYAPDTAATNFLLLAIGIGIFFTALAALVFKMHRFSVLLTMHIIYAVGFGWILPRFLTL